MAQPVAAASVPSNVNTIRPTTTVTNDNVPVGMSDTAPLPVPSVPSCSVGPLNQGYSSESLPHVELVSPMIGKKILEGKNVNLAVLLIPHYEGVMTNEERSDLYSCSTKNPDHRLNKILDLSSFMKAFGIYKSVMTEVYPQRQKELDLYERNIIDMGTRYPGSGFYEYHRQFSAKAAAYLEQHNIKIDWSIRDNILYTNIFTGQQASSCRLCHSLSHDTSFCPQTLHERYSRFDSNQVYKRSDMRGRVKKFFNGQEICNNYNGPKGCIRERCNYSHVCLSCHNSHPQKKCPELMSSKKNDRIKKRADPSQPYNQVSLPAVSTPLNIEQFKHYLEYHPDQEFVKYLIEGFSYGFHTGLKKLPSSTLELNNLLSARGQPEITRNLISKEVEKGFLSGPYENMPFPV